MKVFAEVLPHTLGRVIHRINLGLKRHAPPQVQFVDRPEKADLQVLSVVGKGSLAHLACREYALLQYTYVTAGTPDTGSWLPIFRRARLVMSYLDLFALTGADDFPFHRAPLGVDPTCFYNQGLERRYAVVTSGYDLSQEAIGECHDALFTILGGARGGMVHIGPSFWRHAGLVSREGIPDSELAALYSQARYVSGLRRIEGFELPVVEGLACGARPICFDTPGYRYWFEDHALFVPELAPPDLVHELARVFASDPEPVTSEERASVLAQFDWGVIFNEFWRRVLAPSAPSPNLAPASQPEISYRDAQGGLTMDIGSFPQFVRKAIADAEPLGQNTGKDDLGFGWIYYGLVRNLRPDFCVAIGSRRGFMPFCAGRAMQDNGRGQVIFIDPSRSGEGHPGWSGRGLWSDPADVQKRIADFGLTGRVVHLRTTSEEAFPKVQQMVQRGNVGLVIIDGAHTYQNSLQDFELYSSLMDGGFVVFHDAINPACEVARTLETLRARGYPVLVIERDVGLAMVEIKSIPAVENKWGYLCSPSNRAERILPYVQSILRPGDSVLDIYCGYSSLGPYLRDIKLFGWDRDPRIIQKLRQTLPHHRWEPIDEVSVPFAGLLPENVDVILGLGVSRRNAAWDPKHVLENVRYLLGRYLPRAVLFETAVDYCNAIILDDLKGALLKLGYACREDVVHTNMASFRRRKLLVGERAFSSLLSRGGAAS